MLGSIGNFLSKNAGAIIGAGASLIGGSLTNQASKDISSAATAASAEQAAAQMEFQERMRATQYQTAVEDMKKAGLNPMLAYSQGGAGTPAGASGTAYTAPVKNALGEATSAYFAATQNEADVNLKNVAALNTSAQTNKIQAEIVQIGTQIEKILADTKVSDQTYRNLQETLNQIMANIKFTTAQTAQSSAQTGKTTAETANIEKGIAPSADPAWYRDTKRLIESLKTPKYKGVPIFPNFGVKR